MDDKAVVSEVLEAALVRVVARVQKEWQRELETLRAERRAILSEIRADLAEHKLAVTQTKAGGKRS